MHVNPVSFQAIIRQDSGKSKVLAVIQKGFGVLTMKTKEKRYDWKMYILFFFSFSFIGWCWEVGIHLVRDRNFVNRGVLFGPWLPIYGCGGVVIIFLLGRMKHSLLWTFLYSMIICTVIEYISSWALEMTLHTRWWDYSPYFLNINGRVCLMGTVFFGLGGCAMVHLLAPALSRLYHRIPRQAQMIACLFLITLFSMDTMYSAVHPNMGKGITDYEYQQSDTWLAATKGGVSNGLQHP